MVINLIFGNVVYADNDPTLSQTIDSNIIDSNYKFVENIPTIDALTSFAEKNYNLTLSGLNLTPDQMKIIEYYKIHPLKIGLYEWDPYFVDDNGKYAGMNYYLSCQLQSVLGIKTELITGSFSEIKNKLKNNEVDIVPGLFKSEIDNHDALASNPYYLDMPCIYSTDMRLQSMPIVALQNIRLGKRRENAYFDQSDLDYLTKNHIHINISNFDSDQDLIDALKTGKCDYIIGSMSAIYLSSGLYRVKLLEPELGKLHYVGVSNQDKNIGLIAVINQFLNDSTKENLYLYLDTYNLIRLKGGSFFTPEENELLDKNNKLSVKSLVGLSYPDVFIDLTSKKINGKEIFTFDRICNLLKIKYTNNLSDGSSINQDLTNLKNKKLDVVLGVPDSLERGGITTPTKCITTSKFCVVGYTDNIRNFSDIFKENIGIVEGQIKEKYLQTMFPTKNFKTYYSLDDAYEGLKNGSIDNIIVNEDFYNYLVFYKDDKDLKNCYTLDLDYNGVINFDTTINGGLYASIFSKSLEFINQRELDSSLNLTMQHNYISDITAKAKKQILRIFLPILFLILSFSLVVLYKLRMKSIKLNKIRRNYKDFLKSTNSYFWTLNEPINGIVLSDEAIKLLSLENLRLIQRNNQFIVKLNDSLKVYFVEPEDYLNVQDGFEQIKSSNLDSLDLEFLFAKGQNKNDITKLKFSIRKDVSGKNRFIYGIIQEINCNFNNN